jgi:hypothetical protein
MRQMSFAQLLSRDGVVRSVPRTSTRVTGFTPRAFRLSSVQT